MTPDDTLSVDNQQHRGHDLEEGVLSRVREWTDIVPWLRLARTMRIAASPPLLLATAATYLIWWFGGNAILGVPATEAFSATTAGGAIGPSLAAAFWSVFVWAPAALLMMRQGALLTAKRPMAGLKPVVGYSLRRAVAAWIASIVPLACSLAIGMLLVVVGWLSRIVTGVFVLEALIALLAAIIAIPCGVLVFGSIVAVPLGWAALANERDPDPLDSLSRGYEALFRRPLHLAMYLIVSSVIVATLWGLATGVATAASLIATVVLGWSGCSPSVQHLTTQILAYFPLLIAITSGWSLVGGCYLLLRYDTGGQEVEDLWQPPPTQKPSLPEIPS